jgi:hypothetical protein
MMRVYFGEEPGEECGLCDSCAGLDSEVFDPGDADARHGLHAATDFHGRARKRRRRGEKVVQPPQAPKRPLFPTAIPELLPTTLPPPWVPPPSSEAELDPTFWDSTPADPGAISGEVVIDQETQSAWNAQCAPSVEGDTAEFGPQWSSIRDANIRAFTEWVVPGVISLPVLSTKGFQKQVHQAGPRPNGPQGPQNHPQNRPENRDGGRRRKKRGHPTRPRPERENRGSRLPGVYNPGGD